ILMDAKIYSSSEISFIHETLAKHPEMKVVLFTDDLSNHEVLASLEGGVKGYFTKDMNVQSLIEGLRTIQKGKYWIHPHISNNFAHEYFTLATHGRKPKSKITQAITKPVEMFTEREYQVLQLLASGYNNQRISEKLEVTQSTVKNHVT